MPANLENSAVATGLEKVSFHPKPKERQSPGEGKGYPLQYSGLENSKDRGAWQAIVHGVKKSQTLPQEERVQDADSVRRQQQAHQQHSCTLLFLPKSVASLRWMNMKTGQFGPL